MVEESTNDILAELASRIGDVAYAVTPPITVAQDATGGKVGSLTEAMMGITAALMEIASAIRERNEIESIRERQ